MVGTSERGAPPRVVALMGSYRKGGTIDTVVDEVLAGARQGGAETRKIDLVDWHVEFCRNCRECCTEPGSERGRCAQDDDVDGLLTALEQADAVVLAAPVNYGDVNALTRRFLERMIPYVYWPPERPAPVLRDRRRNKPALLVTSSAAPGLMTRLLARPLRTLREMAKLLGAKPVGSLVVGMAGGRGFRPDTRTLEKARERGRRLLGRGRRA